MIHARKDYDDLSALDAKIPADEPVFLIRGHDPLGALIVRTYARMAREYAVDEDLVKAINIHADKMATWAQEHPHGHADVPDRKLLKDLYTNVS